MASKHRYTYPKIIPGSPCSTLGLSSGSCFPSTQTTNILLNCLCCDTSHQNEHEPTDGQDAGPTGGVIVNMAVFFISGCAVFQRKVGQPASNLENSEVTL